MTIEEYVETKPSRREVAELLCKQANMNVLHMAEYGVFCELAPLFNLTVDDFYDDQEALTEYERNYIGLYNWKVKESVV